MRDMEAGAGDLFNLKWLQELVRSQQTGSCAAQVNKQASLLLGYSFRY